jgi:hypothetical protein
MAAISAISNLTQNLYPLAHEFTSPTTTSATATSISGTVTASPATLAGVEHSTHRKHGGPLLKQIEQAVTRALQSSGPAADPNKVVQDAITSVLKQGGSKARGAGALDADGDDDGTQQTFVQTLTAFGITPEQFRKDLAAAIQNAHTSAAGVPNVSSFPPGLLLDAAG